MVLITLYTTDRFVAVRPAAEPDLELVLLQTRKNVFSVRSFNAYQKLSTLFRSISAAPHTWLLFDMTSRTCRFASFSEARSIIGSTEND